jgi:membrane protease YdiL (CAAX protease family)
MYFSSIGFWGNVLVNSLATLSVATLLLHLRGQSWKTMGLTKPKSYLKLLGIAAVTFVATLGSIMFFEVFLRDILFPVVTSEALMSSEIPESSGDRFPNMQGRIAFFLGVIIIVWIESFLEELQDRGFSLNRFEALFSKIPFSIVFAVIIQAVVFGFRHSSSHGLAGSIVVGIIGLVFGIVYVVSGRNLWPLIIAHCFLNTISMMDEF